MTDGHIRSVPGVAHRDRWPTAVASMAVGGAFFALWFWLLPQWLCFQVEMAGEAHWRWLCCPSVGAGIRSGAPLCLGFRLDRTRNACALRSAAATGGGRLLSPRAEPDVCGVCGGMDRALGRVRPR